MYIYEQYVCACIGLSSHGHNVQKNVVNFDRPVTQNAFQQLGQKGRGPVVKKHTLSVMSCAVTGRTVSQEVRH